MSIVAAVGATLTVAVVIVAVSVMIRHRITMARLGKQSASMGESTQWTEADFAGLEAHFGKPLPDDLRWLYEQRDLITRRGIDAHSTIAPEETCFIDRFLPATVESVRTTWFDIGADRMPFAIDESGNYYAVRVGDRGDSQVLYIDHEQTTAWPLSASLRDFIGQESQ
jgi:SMI1-KNR4 cell-wall